MSPSLLGTTVGRYRIVDSLGKGGMGEVFVGYDEKLDRKVALKSIRAEHRLDSEARARFEREARVLSQLHHPNICAIHDYVEGDGVDFLALELVSGTNLAEAIRRGLDEKLRRSIAEQIAGALVAAHGKGIVHRDLKPDNVMLTEAGQVKVLDFGLSRSQHEEATLALPGDKVPAVGEAGIEPDGTQALSGGSRNSGAGSANVTTLGTVMGTLGYMSPEQARGEVATTASDLYSFGLVLQELFTGESPCEKGLDVATRLEKARAGESLPVRGLDGDTTALIERLKSVAPGVRPSAVDTLERLVWIRRAPVRRRTRILVVAAVAVLVVFALAMAVQTIRARRAERTARLEAERANREAEASRKVSDFLVGIFRVSDPGEAKGNSVTARELLDSAAVKIRKELEGQPEVRARLMDTIGTVYWRLGLYREAEPLVREALATREQVLPADDPMIARSLNNLGNILRTQGRYDEAEPVYRRALEMRQRILPPDHEDLAASYNNLAGLYYGQGKYAEAVTLFEKAAAIREKVLGPDHPDLATALSNLGSLQALLGRHAEAEKHFSRSLSIREKALGPDHPDVAGSLINLALLLDSQSRGKEAEPLLRRSIEIQEATLGPDHPDLGVGLQSLASLCLRQKRYAEAETLYRRALSIAETAVGPMHPDVAVNLQGLGAVADGLGRPVEGEAAFRRALSILETALGPDHPETATALASLGDFLVGQKRFVEAGPLLARSLAVREKVLGAEHPETAAVLDAMARLAEAQGKPADADRLFRRAFEVREKLLGGDHPDTLASVRSLAALAVRDGRRDDAFGWLGRLAGRAGLDPPLAKDPAFAPLAGDSRFAAILAAKPVAASAPSPDSGSSR